MSEHTPGPWQFNWDFTEVQTLVSSIPLAKMLNDDELNDAEQAEANGVLMAAAPDLLAACQAALPVIIAHNREAPHTLRLLRAAITKATEEAP